MRALSLLAGTLLAPLLSQACLAHDPTLHADAKVEGPADDYVYELAAPGSYDLPRIKPAAGAKLLDESGRPVELSALFAGRLTILSFMYTRCGDACPLAGLHLADLQKLAAGDESVSGRKHVFPKGTKHRCISM